MISGRQRITLQLTPLLDLLLIVIFAQYMQVDRQATRIELASEQRVEETTLELEANYLEKVAAVTSQREQLEAERQTVAAQREALEEQNQHLQDERARLQTEEFELRQRIRDLLQQQRRAADLVAELFDVPDELLDQAFSSRGDVVRSDAQVQELRREFRELAEKRGRDVIYHLLTYEELQKRCDVWDLYITENDLIELSTPAGKLTFEADTPGEFSTNLFESYRSLPQPKSLVIVLVTYGDATIGVRNRVRTEMPAVTERMQIDSNRRSRFEYSIIGYIPREPENSDQP